MSCNESLSERDSVRESMPFTQGLIVPLFRSLCERGGRKGEKVGSRDKKCVFLLRVVPVWSVYILWKDIFNLKT